jgi:hypothetical protein
VSDVSADPEPLKHDLDLADFLGCDPVEMRRCMQADLDRAPAPPDHAIALLKATGYGRS